jgi:adenosine deaminase
MAECEKRHGVRMRLIPDMVRDVGPKWGEVTLRWAVEGRRRGCIALGLTGREAIHGNEPFREHFRLAAQEGLHCVAHAGEHAGPESVRSALDAARAERIGHGVRAIEDPGLVAELAKRGVPLEICPTSNVFLGVAPDVERHPFDRLHRAGVRVSINSDDPPMFNTTLSDEYHRVAAAFGYGPEVLAGFALASIEHSFLPAEDKHRMASEAVAQIDALGREIFGHGIAV